MELKSRSFKSKELYVALKLQVADPWPISVFVFYR